MSDEGEGMAAGWLRQALGLGVGDTPFPWQRALLDEFKKGNLPPALDIPTGLGKTSVMGVWLVARALGAPLPRRIVYVVDRRAVVDQASEVALSLRAFVEREPEIKQHLGLGARSLPVSTLRGQYLDNREWLDDPAAPAIIVGTVDMIGSRLLFQGYGVSRKMRPYHAGLLGTDTLVVLDEGHLVPAFEDLLRDIAGGIDLFGTQEEALRALIPQFRLLSMSATGRGGTSPTTFRLTEKDLKHSIIDRRLKAPKRLFIRNLQKDSALPEVLAEEAWRLAGDGKRPIRCIVFCDKRENAVKTKEQVERSAHGDKKQGTEAVGVDLELFVGGRRVFERQVAATTLESLGFVAAKSIQPKRAAFLFATSAAEVGVDLDADCMVCDLVSWERMVQRLGRVNRRGDAPGGANVTVIVEPQKEPDKRTKEAFGKTPDERDEGERKLVQKYETAVGRQPAIRKALDLLCWKEGSADASTGAIRDLNERAIKIPDLRRALDAATTSAPLRPALTRAVVDAWSMTSLESHTGRPEIEPWLRGWIEDDPPQTEIVWRTYLPVRGSKVGDSAEIKPAIEAFFQAAPLHTSEILETETFRVLEWLADRAKALLSACKKGGEPEGTVGSRDVVAIILTKAGKFRRALPVDEFQAVDKSRREELHSLLANSTVIVDVRIAGLKEGLLDPKDTSIPRAADDGQPWTPAIGYRIRNVDAGQEVPRDPKFRERFRFAAEVTEDGEPLRWLIVEKEHNDSADEDDRSAGNPQLLKDHRDWAEERARALAKTLGLTSEFEEALCAAAFLHDEGKQAPRWQSAFNAPGGDDAWAKTEGPINYALLDGYRHEFGTLVSVETNERLQRLSEEHRELALHMIAAHHGFARPFIETRGCDAAPVWSKYSNALRDHGLL
jgi:CRISPR-associated endonuclease/helicase Cas3